MSYRAASVGAYNAAASDAAARGSATPFHGAQSAAAQRRGSSPGAAARGGGEAGPAADAGAREAAGGESSRHGEAPLSEDVATEWAHVAFASLTAQRLAKLRAGRDGAGDGAQAEAAERSVRGGGVGRGSAGKADTPQSPPTPTPHSSGAGGGGSPGPRRLFRRSFFAPDDGLTLRARLHFTLDEPSYSPLAYICSLATVSVVILSCVTFVIETLPQYQTQRAQSFFDRVEVFCIAFFTAEYGLRLLTAPALFPFVRRFANLADIASILPFYLELIIRAGGHNNVGPDPGGYARARLVRIVRLVRLFRLVRVSQRNEKLRVVVAALQESADMLAVLAFLLGIATVIGSTLMFYAEEGNDRVRRPGEPPNMGGPQFHSIPDAFWWCIVTFMTVGYGDVVPVGPEGQLVAALTMIVSFVVLALPISVIGANFTQQWIVYKETTLLTRRTGTLGAEFAELKAELEVHTGVLDEIVNVAHARAVAMEERGAAMRDAAERAGLGSVLHSAPSYDPSDEGEAARRDERAARDSQNQHSPARSNDTPRRSAVPRPALGAAEAELELLLAELEQDAQAAGETFAMAELISSEDFLTRMDAAATKHHRLAAMDVKGSEACAAVHALLASLAADRAARPSLEAAAEATHVPGLARAAAAAAALLASSGFAIGGSPPQQPLQRSLSFRERSRAAGGGGSEPRDLDAVTAAMRASQESLDKLVAARREASVHHSASRTALDVDAI